MDASPSARPIRVLKVLEATAGGTRKHLVSLLRGLDRASFDVEVASPLVRDGHTDDTAFVDEVRALGIRVHAVALHRSVRPWSDLKGLVALWRIIRRGRFDVVHLHSSKAGFLGRVAAKAAGAPTVYTPNGFYFLNAEKASTRAFYRVLEQAVGPLTDRLVAVSDSEREAAAAARIARGRTEVIPNAIETDFFPDAAARQRIRADLGYGDDVVVVGTVARFLRQKDPATFVRAAHRVVQGRLHGHVTEPHHQHLLPHETAGVG